MSFRFRPLFRFSIMPAWLFTNRRKEDCRGVILPVVLVILVILTVIATGLSRTARANLALARRSMAFVSSKYLAWAGIVFAIDEIRRDSRDEESRGFDRTGLCGIAPDPDLTLKERFGRQDLKTGYFAIGYEDGGVHVDGFSDEESRINLNGLNRENINVLVRLLEMSGADENTAKTAAYALLDWKDNDDDLSDEDFGAEDAYYSELSQPYHIKNFFLESVDEMLLVKGVDRAMLEKIRPYVTVYPQDDFLRINLDTASLTVLKASGRAFTGGQTNADPEDADALARKLADYRLGEDGRLGTEDDRRIDFHEISLNQKEQVIAEKLKMLQTSVSDHIRVRVYAVENRRGMPSIVEAVINRNDLSITQWKRE